MTERHDVVFMKCVPDKFRTKIRYVALLSVSLLALSVGARSQQAPRRSDTRDDASAPRASVQSDLARENMDRVAASAADIKAVLITQPGLMVELKRWIAKEASDNGQLVDDADLTDPAVFDRLAVDVRFRSVATRLLQRYGYLLPDVNPESSMGKQEEVLIKERARRIVQIEAQEDAESLKPPKQPISEAKTVPCDWNADRDCVQTPQTTPGRGAFPPGTPTQRESAPASPDDNRPLRTPVQPVLQADMSLDGLINGPVDGNSLLQNVSSPVRPQSEVGVPSNTPMTPSAPLSAGRPGGVISPGVGADSTFDEVKAPESSGTGTTPGTSSLVSRQPRLATRNRELSTGMVHRPNPYADIPSLYDLYVQAPSRDVPPQRFGTEVFRDGLRDPRSIPMDLPVGPDYVVGPGDSLTIDLWGGVSTKMVRVVDRQGRVTLPEAGPLLVSGHSLGDVQQAVQRAIGTQFRDTNADVSVSRLRTVRVYVVGEVQEPGAYDISSLSTALNALVAAGGVTSKGSLRTLKHMRGRQQIEEIDTYDLLLHGVSPDAQKLENGDSLVVPPMGAQVTVTGMVRRPAIYELNGEKSLADVLELAGGILPAAALRHVEVQRLEAHEKHTMLSLDLSPDDKSGQEIASFRVQDGDIIHIFPIAPYNQSTIYLQGHVLRPGRYSYRDGMKFTDLVAGYQDILPEPAAHYAEIVRLNAPDFHPVIVSFDLSAAMKDPTSAPALQPLDTVRVFSRFDFEPAPTVSISGEVRSPGTYQTSGQATLRDAVYLAGGLTPDAALNTAQVFRFNPDGSSEIFSVKLGDALSGSAVDNIVLQPRDRLLIHRNTSRVQLAFVDITGEVAKPGRYPYTENMHAEDLIRAAGGLKRSADTTKADLTSYSATGAPGTHVDISLASLANGNPTEDVPLRPGDVLSIREKAGWKDIGASVKVSGEVTHPSTYGIQPGERLSAVLLRSGGFTIQAYPYGAVLMRREVREMEARNQEELINRLKAERMQLKALPEGDVDQKNAKLNVLAQTDSTISQLSATPPIGRVVIHITSDIQHWKGTPADIALRDGDVLMIPKKANVVMVSGQVFNPTAVSAQSGRSAKWYLSQAGGLTPIADKKAVFVLRADGSVISAKNNSAGWWSGDPMSAALRPGDAIIVPEKTPKIGGVNWTAIMQTAQVASSIALAVAYIHP
jgi:protein involved in polysaccharide export with SLBB domain